MGEVFTHDIRAAGVAFDTPASDGAKATGRCLIVITPDAQRTMHTFLGAAADVSPVDVAQAVIEASEVVYLEGYLWDQPPAKEAFLRAAAIAAAAGRKVALTLSDRFCVERHRAEFLDLVERHVDILFANEEEIKALYEVDDFDSALQIVRGKCDVAALTRSEKGSVVVRGDEVHVVDAEKGVEVVDTTGAGDAYAAGFLYGYTAGLPLQDCAKLAGILAAEVISHIGPRPEADLKALAAAAFRA
jgi:sugar/nucleoside kinase (ribokinase family)